VLTISTGRLVLRRWLERDRAPFAAINAGLGEVVSFTSTVNDRSRAVMRRLGMTHDPADDFDHSRVPPGPLRRHVLYRMTEVRWRAARCGRGARRSAPTRVAR
jgi:hypothetical protein